MALPRGSTRKLGKLELSILDFDQAGDELPVHVHGETDNHITFVARGGFKVIGHEAIAGRILELGDVIDWPAGQPHGFVALTNRARLIQVPK